MCFHKRHLWECFEYSREGDKWSDTGFIDLKVQKATISEGKKRKYGAGFESHGAILTAESENTYTTSYNDHHARGYRFILELKGIQWGFYALYQDKWAKGSGQLMRKHVESETARAKYKFDWKTCSCGDAKTPDY